MPWTEFRGHCVYCRVVKKRKKGSITRKRGQKQVTISEQSKVKRQNFQLIISAMID